MTTIIIELSVNLFQSVMLIGFLFLFFEKSHSYKTNFTAFISASIALFAIMSLLNYFKVYVSFADSLVYMLIMELYTMIFLKGSILLRIIMPILNIIITYIISFLYGFIISFITGVPFSNLISQASVNRYISMIMINLTALFFFWLILRFKKQKLSLTKWSDILAFIIIPLATLIIINCAACIIYHTQFQTSVLVYSLVICASMISVTIIVFLLMTKISKTNEVETKLLLSQQKEYLYRENVLQTNAQIEKISKIKHDMQNQILCIGKLISEGRYEKAERMCETSNIDLSLIYTPLHTDNPLLNAIVNTEIEKAISHKIDLKLIITNSMYEFSDNPDIISIIGNMCDNAIEYLSSLPADNRKMILEISLKNRYFIILCKNAITESVLSINPELKTKKDSAVLHGKGIEIIRNITDKNQGDFKIYEENAWFNACAVLKVPSIPKKC